MKIVHHEAPVYLDFDCDLRLKHHRVDDDAQAPVGLDCNRPAVADWLL